MQANAFALVCLVTAIYAIMSVTFFAYYDPVSLLPKVLVIVLLLSMHASIHVFLHMLINFVRL